MLGLEMLPDNTLWRYFAVVTLVSSKRKQETILSKPKLDNHLLLSSAVDWFNLLLDTQSERACSEG